MAVAAPLKVKKIVKVWKFSLPPILLSLMGVLIFMAWVNSKNAFVSTSTTNVIMNDMNKPPSAESLTPKQDVRRVTISEKDLSAAMRPISKEPQHESAGTIAYAISVTQCDPKSPQADQAAILLHSIHRNSIRSAEQNRPTSKYDYHAFAFVHPEAEECATKLRRIGWDVQIKPTPVEKSDIKGPLKEFVHEASCCAEKEFLKLYSYSLTDYPVAVHLDLDCLVVQPLDELYDSMIQGSSSPAREKLKRQWPNKELPENIEAFFTRDYNMVDAGAMPVHQIGVQGGFLVVKPNMDTFKQYKEIIIKGDYTRDDGWGGEYGGYFGAAQIQGLCAYFFGAIKPETAVELHRCYYNFMGDNPYNEGPGNKCKTLEETCEDCRTIPFSKIKTIHFTTCSKPWWCEASELNDDRRDSLGPKRFKTCVQAHHRWFQTRLFLEKEWAYRDSNYEVTKAAKSYSTKMKWTHSTTLGFCRKGSSYTPSSYTPMKFPKNLIPLDHSGIALESAFEPETVTKQEEVEEREETEDAKDEDKISNSDSGSEMVAPLQTNERTKHIKIGYAVSVTKCDPSKAPGVQAAVVLYSIHQNSVRNPESGSKYDYHPYAFLHPEAEECKETLELVGWDVQIRPTPVLKEEIKGRLKEFVHEASCCQEKEFLKLYAYTLLQHPVVVHLDLDSLVLQPLDDLYDSMIYDSTDERGQEARNKLSIQWKNKAMPDQIEGFFTRDYNMLNYGARQPHQTAVQGGFIVVKPNLEVYEKYRAVIIDGNYTRGYGWGGKLRYGGYYGAAQIQGLCAYFFGAVRPNTTVELNRCVYNFMSDDPRDANADNKCKTQEDDCEDCRQKKIEDIKSVHFTLCGKPWWCQRRDSFWPFKKPDTCTHAHYYWFRTRLQIEREWARLDPGYSVTPEAANYDPDWKNITTFGFCQRGRGFMEMKLPKARIELPYA